MILMDLFRPKWKNSDSKVRLEAVKNLIDQTILIEIAKNDMDTDVRQEAVKKLTNQTELAEIARNNNDKSILLRLCAVEKITNQEALIDISKNTISPSVRLASAIKLDDKSLAKTIYADVIKKSKDADEILEAAELLIDPALLADKDISRKLVRIALTHSNRRVCRNALSKVINQKTLFAIAKRAKNENTRQDAIDFIDDQALLTEIVQDDKNSFQQHPWVRESAVRKLTDQTLLTEIAKSDKDESVCSAATNAVTEQALLAEIAKTAMHINTRVEAIKKLVDQSLLVSFANDDKTLDVRIAAVEKITDQTLLVGFARNDKAPSVREASVKNITDQQILNEIARNDKEEIVRRAASLAIKMSKISEMREIWEKKLENASIATLFAIIREMGDLYKGDGFDDPVYKAIKQLQQKGIKAVVPVIKAFGNNEMLARWNGIDLKERVAPHLIGEIIFDWLKSGVESD